MTEMSFHSTIRWTLLSGLFVLYAPQPSIFHEVNKRSIREDSDSIRYSDSDLAAQSTTPRRRRQIDSSSSSSDEGSSNFRYQYRPTTSDSQDAGPSSRPDHPECPMITPRRRTPPPDQHRPLNATLQSFLQTPFLTNQQRKSFRNLIERKLPTIYNAHLNAIVQSFTGQKSRPWDQDEREYFVRGFLQDPPVGWNKATCEEYLRVYFQTESPGWSPVQIRYVTEHLLQPPSKSFNAEDHEFYLDSFLLEHPQCWQSGLREVFITVFHRNIPRGKEETYAPLLECFLKAPPNCWTDEQRRAVVYGFLQSPPSGWSPEQRLQFMHNFASTGDRCLVFREDRFEFQSTQQYALRLIAPQSSCSQNVSTVRT